MQAEHRPGTEPAEPTQALSEAREQRADLHLVIVGLEQAIAKPASGRALDWASGVHDALVDVGAAFERHIAVVEGPGGLFDEVTQAAPRLESALGRLRADHRDIRGAIAEALDAVRHIAGADATRVPDQGRDTVIRVLEMLMRHRQVGADVVYEAYAVDIGTGD